MKPFGRNGYDAHDQGTCKIETQTHSLTFGLAIEMGRSTFRVFPLPNVLLVALMFVEFLLVTLLIVAFLLFESDEFAMLLGGGVVLQLLPKSKLMSRTWNVISGSDIRFGSII